MDYLSLLPVDLFIQQISYLSFQDVISICCLNSQLHDRGINPKYKAKWKALIDGVFSFVPNYVELLTHLQDELKTDYNYLIYVGLIKKLDPISQLIIYYRQGDRKIWNSKKEKKQKQQKQQKQNKEKNEKKEKNKKEKKQKQKKQKKKYSKAQKFLALFMLNKPHEMKKYLCSQKHQPFIDLRQQKSVSQKKLNGMARFMATHGYMPGLLLLKEEGADLHINNEAALEVAAERGHLDIVKYLVEQGANIHPPENEDSGIMHLALENGHLEVVKYLVEQGVKINGINEYLEIAVENGHLSIVKYLVELGGVIDNPHLALKIAVEDGYLDIVKYLLSSGINVLHLDEYLDLALHDGRLSIFKHLMGSEDTIEPDVYLDKAIKYGHLNIARYLIKLGATLEYPNFYIQVAVKEKYFRNRLKVIKFLVQQGGDIHAYREQALIVASERGYLDVVKYLVKQGADIHAQNEAAVFGANSYHHLSVVKYLIKRGANIHVNDEMWACQDDSDSSW